jgi:uncharacterized iron-regulated membrane protein
MVRKTVFWIHLIVGVAAGVVVAMMSLTGALLTYERQILAWSDRDQVAMPTAGGERQPLADLVAAAAAQRSSPAPTAVTIRNDPDAPVAVAFGRGATLLVNPYTGAVAEQGSAGLRSFFAAVEGWHRWFNVSDENRDAARAVTGACNLAFLFLVLSGPYLWLPRMWKWAAFRARLKLNAKAASGKARDFNWHHVFGIWSALPLAVVVASAIVFSYPWANNLVYRSVGEEPPVRSARGAADASRRPMPGGVEASGSPAMAAARLPYDALLAKTAERAAEWRTITLQLPVSPADTTLRFSIDQGNGGQPQRRQSITFDASTGEVREWLPFAAQSTGQKARTMIRFLHTGEALGVVGQTVAGVVSAASLIMVWTGLALAYRRLVTPWLRRGADAAKVRRASEA